MASEVTPTPANLSNSLKGRIFGALPPHSRMESHLGITQTVSRPGVAAGQLRR